MIDQAGTELAPLVGVGARCAAVGEAQARWYRRSPSPPPQRERVPAAQISARMRGRPSQSNATVPDLWELHTTPTTRSASTPATARMRRIHRTTARHQSSGSGSTSLSAEHVQRVRLHRGSQDLFQRGVVTESSTLTSRDPGQYVFVRAPHHTSRTGRKPLLFDVLVS
jgi:hypothetical protein